MINNLLWIINHKYENIKIKGRKNYELLKFLKEAIEAKSMLPQLTRVDSSQKSIENIKTATNLNGKLNQNDTNSNIIKQSSLRDTPKKIKTLEQ